MEDLTPNVERALRKVLPLALSIQASQPSQVTAEALAEELAACANDEPAAAAAAVEDEQ